MLLEFSFEAPGQEIELLLPTYKPSNQNGLWFSRFWVHISVKKSCNNTRVVHKIVLGRFQRRVYVSFRNLWAAGHSGPSLSSTTLASSSTLNRFIVDIK